MHIFDQRVEAASGAQMLTMQASASGAIRKIVVTKDKLYAISDDLIIFKKSQGTYEIVEKGKNSYEDINKSGETVTFKSRNGAQVIFQTESQKTILGQSIIKSFVQNSNGNIEVCDNLGHFFEYNNQNLVENWTHQ